MSIRAALDDPVMKVVVALGMVPLALAALYWIAMLAIDRRYQMLSTISETWRVAQACQRAVEEYYGRSGRMPASEKDVDCHRGGGNVAPVKVASGKFTITASATLREALEDADSGIDLRFTPTCDGPCTGARIVSWDCATGSTVERRYRPAFCR